MLSGSGLRILNLDIGLDVSDLPRVKAAGEATARLLREIELSKDGITPGSVGAG